MLKLFVTQPFGPYSRGDEITDPDTVQAILDSERQVNVVKVLAPDPAPDATDLQ